MHENDANNSETETLGLEATLASRT